jgi:hypothetical protein
MSAGEIRWRIGQKLRVAADRALLSRRQDVAVWDRLWKADGLADGCRAESLLPAELSDQNCHADFDEEWKERLVAKADRLVAHRFDLFDRQDELLGDEGGEIDWNHEAKAGKEAPMGFAPSIDYRDYESAGDCKWVWEPNRHHHFVVLARAFRATGDEKYAREIWRQWESWIEQCPYGYGMNWRSPLELGIRLINWCWTLALIGEQSKPGPELEAAIITTACRHIWDIPRQYSRYSSANNHLIGEAAGVYVGCRFFGGYADAKQKSAEAKAILEREILSQTFADGGTQEQALGYHTFVIWFFLLSGLSGRRSGDEFSRAYWDRLEKMHEFLAVLVKGGDRLPMFGDADDGYVLDLGDRREDAMALTSMASVLLERPDLKSIGVAFPESAWWLLGPSSVAAHKALGKSEEVMAIQSRAFPETGLYLLQSGSQTRKEDTRISVGIDCGPLGFGPIAAHGHADALSVTLRVFGRDILIDPGTYDYFSFAEWRNFFRSTAGHNTIEVDGVDQSEMKGPFLWSHRATCECTRWEPSDDGGIFEGIHYGYQRLPGSVLHRRLVQLEASKGEIVIEDKIEGVGKHDLRSFWHFSEEARVDDAGGQSVRCAVDELEIEMEWDHPWTCTLLRGSESPRGGWVSRGYHRLAESSSAVCVSNGVLLPLTIRTVVRVEERKQGRKSSGRLSAGVI